MLPKQFCLQNFFWAKSSIPVLKGILHNHGSSWSPMPTCQLSVTYYIVIMNIQRSLMFIADNIFNQQRDTSELWCHIFWTYPSEILLSGPLSTCKRDKIKNMQIVQRSVEQSSKTARRASSKGSLLQVLSQWILQGSLQHNWCSSMCLDSHWNSVSHTFTQRCSTLAFICGLSQSGEDPSKSRSGLTNNSTTYTEIPHA